MAEVAAVEAAEAAEAAVAAEEAEARPAAAQELTPPQGACSSHPLTTVAMGVPLPSTVAMGVEPAGRTGDQAAGTPSGRLPELPPIKVDGAASPVEAEDKGAKVVERSLLAELFGGYACACGSTCVIS